MAQDRMRILIADGVGWVTPRGEAEASDIGTYWNAVRRYRRTGDDSGLWPYEGMQIAGHTLETDPDVIDYWAATGELDFEDIYEEGEEGS